jgi:hypothetical protein
MKATVIVTLLTFPSHAATFTVDLSTPLKPVDHAAFGALYGIAAPGWPLDSWITPLHPKNFTQMAPGGGQLPNGETVPVGDALVVAPVAAKAGAAVTIRLPDSFPSFPYIWQGEAFWDAAIDRVVGASVKANPANIYAYEIWNEPDWTWQAAWGDFDAEWAKTWRRIRGLDAGRPIMGPSLSKWDGDWMRRFLTSAVASQTVPEIVSWHELDPAQADDIEAHVLAFRALERELKLTPHKISINEYGSPRAMADPGALTHYIAELERAGVDTADLAFWHRPGRLSDLLVPVAGGHGPARDAAPTGAYWLYAWYGGMSGQMVAAHSETTGVGHLDGFAAVNGATSASVVIGGEVGSHSVEISGLAGFGPVVKVLAQVTHWTGTDGAEAAPEALFSGRIAVKDGAISMPVTLARASDAAELMVAPDAGAVPAGGAEIVMAANPITQRYEAEDGTIVGGRKFAPRMSFFANHASGDAYVGLFNRQDAALSFAISAPKAGSYDLGFGYSNGLDAASQYGLSINGVPAGEVSFPPTQARELMGLVHVPVTLPAGSSTVTLSAGGVLPKVFGVPSVLEVDYLDVTGR